MSCYNRLTLQWDGESEEDICGETPNCELCKERHPNIWRNCKSLERRIG